MEHKGVRVDLLYNIRMKRFSFQEQFCEIQSQMHAGIHVKCPLFLSGFNETLIFFDRI